MRKTLLFILLAAAVGKSFAQTSPTEVSCQNNGSIFSASDDYITFTLDPDAPSPFYEAPYTYTITAMQGSTPLAIVRSDGDSGPNFPFGNPMPFRTPNGTAGQGNITLTITPYGGNTPTVVTLTDPGSCALSTTVCIPGEKTISSSYRAPLLVTELQDALSIIPKFQETANEILTKVDLNLTGHIVQSNILESTAANSSGSLYFKTTSDGYYGFDGGVTNPLLTTNVAYTSPTVSNITAQIVPASGTWPGDATYGNGTNVSTLIAMTNAGWLNQALIHGIDPTADPRWVTNATGNPTTDDDMVLHLQQMSNDSKSFSYTTAGNPTMVNNFKGTGTVPLKYTTVSEINIMGGGGNMASIQTTQSYFTVNVTYTYLKSCTALPVKLVAFKAKQSEQNVVFDWEVAEETNVNNYEIEQSSDSKNFQLLTSVKASNQNFYQAIQENVQTGRHYFRLKSNDTDGTFAYSRIIELQVIGDDFIKVFPNPTTDYIHLSASLNADIQAVELINNKGVVIKSLSGISSDNMFNVKELPNGLYMVHTKLRNGQSVTKKVMINK